MRKAIVIAAFVALGSSSIAFADGNGALTGAAGGAVTGALVGGPVGAVVGGTAGAVVGGAATGPDRTVVVQPGPAVAPCASQTTQTTDSDGNSSTTRTTNCSP